MFPSSMITSKNILTKNISKDYLIYSIEEKKALHYIKNNICNTNKVPWGTKIDCYVSTNVSIYLFHMHEIYNSSRQWIEQKDLRFNRIPIQWQKTVWEEYIKKINENYETLSILRIINIAIICLSYIQL